VLVYYYYQYIWVDFKPEQVFRKLKKYIYLNYLFILHVVHVGKACCNVLF